MRVLHVIDGLGPGGAEALLFRLVQRSSNVDHEVASLGDPDWYSDRLEQIGVTVHHLSKGDFAMAPAAIVQLRRIIRKSRPDVVQTWLYTSNMLGGIAARSTGTPVVWGIHCSSLEPFGPVARALVRLSGLASRWIPDFIINCSARSAELHQRLGYGAAPGAVVHNGYDSTAFAPDEAARETTRRSLGIPPETFLIGNIARWHMQKDIPNLLEAVRIVEDRGVSVRCLLIGRGLGADNPALRREIEASEIGDRIVPLGERSNIPELARAIDLHVLASCGAEAFPNVVGETMLSGTPNVVTDVGDSALMVGDTGWVVPPRNADALADAICAAWRESTGKPAEWQKRRSAARQRIAERFTFETMAEAYEQVWRRIASDG